MPELVSEHIAAAAQELLKRRKARECLLSYMQYMYETGHSDFQHAHELAPHQLLVVEELQELADNPGSKLGVSMPPGSAKSQIVSIAFPTWLLARKPSTQIVAAAATENLSEQFARRRRNAMQTDEWKVLSGTELSVDARSLIFQATQEGGCIRSAGMGTSIVGTRADFTITDDPVSGIEEAFSLTRLDAQVRWYDAELRSRLKPGGSEAICMTRWSPEDLLGNMLTRHEKMKEVWRFVRLPMECDDEETDPLGRKLGDPLWPGHYTEQQIKEAKSSPMMWSGLYMQRPVLSVGDWCSAEDITIVDELPRKAFGSVLSCDLALTLTANADYTVIAACKVDADKNIYLVDLYRKRATPDMTSQMAVEMCKTHKPGMFLLDFDNAARVWAVHAEEKAKRAKVPLPVRLMKHGGQDKQSRASALRGHIHEKRLFLLRAHWNSIVLNELASMPLGRHDDIVDALANVSRDIHNIAPRKHEKAKEAPFKGQIIALPVDKTPENSHYYEYMKEKEEETGEVVLIGDDDSWEGKRWQFQKERLG